MPIHGVDISRYQPASAMDGYDFVIINAEDPTFNDKVAYARDLGIPWGEYTWIYPGNGRRDMERGVRVCEPHGEPPMGHWLDYEQAGVSEGDIDAALGRARELGVLDRTGVYTYLHVLNGTDVEDHLQDCPLWIAYYPRNNDGSYPGDQTSDAHKYGAVMWQYTSGANAPVGLDKNVVLDEDWYQSWTGDDVDFTNMPLDQALALSGIIEDAVNRALKEKLSAPDVFAYAKFIQDQVKNASEPAD